MQPVQLSPQETSALAEVRQIVREVVAGTVPAHAVDDIAQEAAVAATSRVGWLSTTPPPVLRVWARRVAATKRADWFREAARHERRVARSAQTQLADRTVAEEVELRVDAERRVRALLPLLSPQECLIASHLADGLTVGEIAMRAELSVSSVKTYLGRIRQKSVVI